MKEDELRAAAAESSDLMVRVSAIQALANHPQPETVALLTRLLGDPRDAISLALAKLAPFVDPFPVDQLCRLPQDEDADVQSAAVEALGAWGSPEAVETMHVAARDPDLTVRADYLAALARVDARSTAPADRLTTADDGLRGILLDLDDAPVITSKLADLRDAGQWSEIYRNLDKSALPEGTIQLLREVEGLGPVEPLTFSIEAKVSPSRP